jgi:hypothetical protein
LQTAWLLAKPSATRVVILSEAKDLAFRFEHQDVPRDASTEP